MRTFSHLFYRFPLNKEFPFSLSHWYKQGRPCGYTSHDLYDGPGGMANYIYW